MAVAHQTLPAILGGQVRMGGKKVRHLGFDRSSQELARSLAQHVGQQIFEFPWLAQGNNGIVLQGVSLLREMWSASSPPRYAASSQTDVTNFAAYLAIEVEGRFGHPHLRQISPTGVPLLACLKANAICSSLNRFFGIWHILRFRTCARIFASVWISPRGEDPALGEVDMPWAYRRRMTAIHKICA
jgi:hypothetical protein